MSFKRILITIAVGVLLIIADYFQLLNPIKTTVSKVTLPIQIGFNQFTKKIGQELAIVLEMGRLRDRNRDLEYTTAILTAENAVLKNLETENKVLKEQLKVNIRSKKLIPAHSIGFSSIGTIKYLMIDRGSSDGVQKDSLVVLKDILIGKVIAVSSNSSNILLVTDPEFKIPAVTSAKSKGLVLGQYQQDLKMTKVLPEEKLSIGDMVFTSGEAGFPESLVIGSIDKVIKSDREIFQEAVLKTLLNLEKLDIVFVLDKDG